MRYFLICILIICLGCFGANTPNRVPPEIVSLNEYLLTNECDFTYFHKDHPRGVEVQKIGEACYNEKVEDAQKLFPKLKVRIGSDGFLYLIEDHTHKWTGDKTTKYFIYSAKSIQPYDQSDMQFQLLDEVIFDKNWCYRVEQMIN